MRRLLGIAALLATLPMAAAAATLPAAASDALREGDCPAARAALTDAVVSGLDGELGQATTLALAQCEVRTGAPERALSRLSLLPADAFANQQALLRGEALLLLGRPGDAADALQGAMDAAGTTGQRARLLRGRACVEAARYEDARLSLLPLIAGSKADAGALPDPGGTDPGEARWWLAEGARRRGEPERALPVLQAIWTKNPTSPWSGPAEALLRTQGVSLDPATPDGALLVRARVQAFEALRMYPEALALRQTLPAASRSSARAEARAAFLGKDYGEAAARFREIPSPTAQEAFDLALATSRTGDYAAAAELYQEVQRRFPGTDQADFASYKIAYLAYDAADLDRAIRLFQDHLNRRPTTGYAAEARWFIAWSQVRLGQDARAAESLELLRKQHPQSELAPAARYWQARLNEKAGESLTARGQYDDVLTRWPDSSHAWFAAQRLGTTYPASKPAEEPAPPAALADGRWRRGRALAAVGLDEWAREELLPLRSVATGSGKVALGWALVDAGAYREAQALVRGSCGNPARTAPEVAAVCWPRPSAGVVGRVAGAGGLDRNLPYAIMYAESAFNPRATSIAGARGLMQLMPNLALSLAATRWPSRSFHPDELYLPATNAALGTAELVSLRERLGGLGVSPTLPLVIAGYNGGEEAVKRWVGGYASPPEADVFAEDIGYTETRRYVRTVLGYLQTWRRVYGDG